MKKLPNPTSAGPSAKDTKVQRVQERTDECGGPRTRVEAEPEAGDLLAGRMEEARAKFFTSMMVDSERRSTCSTSSSSAHRTGTSVLPALGEVNKKQWIAIVNFAKTLNRY